MSRLGNIRTRTPHPQLTLDSRLDAIEALLKGLSGTGLTATLPDTSFTLQRRAQLSATMQLAVSSLQLGGLIIYTLPYTTIDTTLVGTDTFQTMTNKAFSGTGNSFVVNYPSFVLMNADPTQGQMYFDLSGMVTGILRGIRVQDASYTLAGTNIAQTFSALQSLGAGLTMNAGLMTLGGASDGILCQSNAEFDGVTFIPGNVIRIHRPSLQADYLNFNCNSLTTGRSWTVQDLDGTVALLGAAQTWTTLQTFKTSTIKVVDATDASKTLVWQLSGASAGADLILAWAGTVDGIITLPDATTTLAGLAVAETFTALQTLKPSVSVSSDALLLDIDAPSSNGQRDSHKIILRGTSYDGTAHTAEWRLFNDINLNSGVSSFRIQQQLDGSGFSNMFSITDAGIATVSGGLAISSILRCNTSASGIAHVDNADTSKALRHICSALPTGTNSTIELNGTTEAKVWGWPDTSGYASVVGRDTTAGAPAAGKMSKVDRTGQTAGIASVNMTNGARTGFYAVYWDIEVTAYTAGTIQAQVSYTDDIGATNQTDVAFGSLNGRDRGVFTLYLASGELSFQTNATAWIGTYNVRMRPVFLG